MMHAKDAMEDSAVNVPELLARVEYDRDFLREVFEIFNQEFPPLNEILNDAVARADVTQIRTAAHTMTGMLASVSFTKASASAMRIGRMARENALDGLRNEMTRLERQVAAAQAELAMVCQEVVH